MRHARLASSRLASLGRAAACLMLFSAPASRAVAAPSAIGFAEAMVTQAGAPPLPVAIWYPTPDVPKPGTLMLLDQTVASNGAVSPGRHPLVVISHGNGGTYASHIDTALALAEAGFVVAAPMHAGDNYRDHSQELTLWTRPPQIRATIDHMLHDWRGHASIDPARIGMFGFSAGGFTTLVAIGGRPDYARIGPFCAAHADAFVCHLIASHHIVHPGKPPDSVWIADARIKAAVIAAPALGFTFGRDGLASIHVPIQLWGAADDHVLPVAFNADAVRRALPQPPEYHLVAGADHADFLSPCSKPLAALVPIICQEPEGFDRAAFHRVFDAAIVAFFRARLAAPG